VHCLFAWLADGLHLIDLGSGFGTQLNGAPVRDEVVGNGHKVTVGTQGFTVKLAGDPKAPAAERAKRRRNTFPTLALAAFYGPHAGQTVLLPSGRPLVLGRADDADLSLPGETQIRPRQVELTLEAFADDGVAAPPVVVQVRDLAGGVVINRQGVPGA